MGKLLLLVVVLTLTAVYPREIDDDPDFIQNKNSQLAVRAVIIKCEIPEEGYPSDSDSTRFQREELFKHDALRDCKQKLAITIKMSSDPKQASGDEYIPIEHVLGVNKKRIRLLNPYVLRLRRKTPFQAYKLRRIDTVRGVIAKTYDKESIGIATNNSRRMQRDLSNLIDDDSSASYVYGPLFKLDHDKRGRHSYSIKIRDLKQPLRNISLKKGTTVGVHNFDQSYICPKSNDSLKQNLRAIRDTEYYKYNFARRLSSTDFIPEKQHQAYDKTKYKQSSEQSYVKQSLKIPYKDREPLSQENEKTNYAVKERLQEAFNSVKSNEMNSKLFNKDLERNLNQRNKMKSDERDLALYEIGDPDLWFGAQLQLFEKLSTPEGKTVWNDLTKDQIASVSTANPEWSNQGVDIRYKPAEFLSREDFILPLKGLCLVVPLSHNHKNTFKDKSGEFIIVPMEDVIILDGGQGINKRDVNSSEYNSTSSERKEQSHRQVIVRAVRALMGGIADSLKIVSRGSDRYLKLPHTKSHYAQMDLEARADDNELVLVGILGRLTTIVSDTSRRVRSILTVQVTNTGLAAARFRVVTRECTPELIDGSSDVDETKAGPVLLPPRHTQNFRLTLPIQTPIESTNCTIALVNEEDESVAVRDVKIKQDDRCYCVWYCDCVCLSEDPKLLCRDMSPAQLLAAGLSTQHKLRHARLVCYPDVISLNLFVTFIGVLLALLLLGIVKALLGLVLRCVGLWGLQLLLQMPRKLDHYYEYSLRNQRVVYDDEGWPVHPDTKERTVRLVSNYKLSSTVESIVPNSVGRIILLSSSGKSPFPILSNRPMEFILNLIFFITLPCVMIWDTMKKMASRCQVVDGKSDTKYRNENKKCFSSQDVQGMAARYRRRRGGLRRWMTPQAEELTTGIWQESLTPLGSKSRDCLRPLLREETCFRKTCEQSSYADSEQDDTEYVLMQMQKSRESLAYQRRYGKLFRSAAAETLTEIVDGVCHQRGNQFLAQTLTNATTSWKQDTVYSICAQRITATVSDDDVSRSSGEESDSVFPIEPSEKPATIRNEEKS